MIFHYLPFLHLQKKPIEFKAGDKVEAFGCKGTVKGISTNGMFLEVILEGAPTSVVFNRDGKLFSWAKEITLKHVD